MRVFITPIDMLLMAVMGCASYIVLFDVFVAVLMACGLPVFSTAINLALTHILDIITRANH